jgi:PhoH-like ATPase
MAVPQKSTRPTRSTGRSQTQRSGGPEDEGGVETAVKTFVLDTNVLLHNPDALFVFQDNHIVIPYPVIEELDKMKRREDDVGRNARESIRHLDRLRQQGKLQDGVSLGVVELATRVIGAAGGIAPTGNVSVDVVDHERPPVIHEDQPDNRIIACAWHLHRRGVRAVFVSKDLSARIKSDALGIKTEDFENQKVDADRLYTGFAEVVAPGELIDELYRQRMLALARLSEAAPAHGAAGGHSKANDSLNGHANGKSSGNGAVRPAANQYVVLHDAQDEAHSGIARRLADTENLIPVSGQKKPVFGVMARNVQQTMALDLLLDDSVKLVTLLGSAGTGKTLLAIAAGMTKVFSEQRYDKLLVARPIMPMGRDIGYLPGDKDEKLTAWMQPIFDNLSYLLSTRGSPNQQADGQSGEQRINKLIADGKLVLEPLTYIRGRSIPHQFMIVDEAQNLTPHEVKTIVSRVGEGTKIVLTGDIQQIDNPYLDQSSNGLSYAIEKLRGSALVGHVTLTKSERSELASLAAAKL